MRSIALAVLSLLVVLNIVFFPAIWEDKTLLSSASGISSITPMGAYSSLETRPIPRLPRSLDPGACAWFAEPSYAALHNQLFIDHTFPLWNPYNGFGVPFMANMQSQPLNPLAILSWLYPCPKLVDLYVIARLFCAGLLMYLYLSQVFAPRTAWPATTSNTSSSASRGASGASGLSDSPQALPALLGAIAYMLTGYFLLYLNMPEISVACYIPGMMWSLELLVRGRTLRQSALVAVFLALVVLGGMPELGFLSLALGTLYFAVRLLCERLPAGETGRCFLLFALAALLGAALSAPQALPFLEYLKQSFNAHEQPLNAPQPGAAYIPNLLTHLLAYLSPLIFGPVGLYTPPLDGMAYFGLRGYWGAITCYLAFLGAAITLMRLVRRRLDHGQPLDWIAAFACITFFFFLGKTFGVQPLQLLGNLPVFKLILFMKYSEPFMALSVAILAGLALFWLGARRVSVSSVRNTFALSLLFYLIDALTNFNHTKLFWIVFATTLGFLLVGFLITFLMARRPSAYRRLAPYLIAAVALELIVVMPIPTFYFTSPLPSSSLNPYSGAPFVSYLQKENTNQERILGLDTMLAPNWSSAFQLCDARDIDAIYPERYLPFVRNFATGRGEAPANLSDNNLTTRFVGTEEGCDPLLPGPDPDLLQRFWRLSSIRYLLAARNHFIPPPTPVMVEAVRRNREIVSPAFMIKTMCAGGIDKFVIFLHPQQYQSNQVGFVAQVPKDKPWLHFAIGMDDEAVQRGQTDGVTFKMQTESTVVKDIFKSALNPVADPKDRGWHSGNIDLSEYAGKYVPLVIAIGPGKHGSNADDWAGFADLTFVSAPTDTLPIPQSVQPPKEVFSNGAHIYRLDNPLPRAAVFYDVQMVPSGYVVLDRLKLGTVDLGMTVFVEESGLRPTDQKQLAALKSQKKPCTAQSIEEYKPNYVNIHCRSHQAGLLMLNDTIFPGWQAYIDGQPVNTVNADYLFRGVFVPAGEHKVEFKYQPSSFQFGGLCALVSLLVLLLLSFKSGRPKRTSQP